LYSSEGNNNRQAHCPDKSNTVFAIFAAPKAKKSKHTPKWEIAPAEQNPCVPPCIFVPDRELDCLTDSHVKLNILDDIQELLNNSHNKRAFNYDEDTTSLVEEPTLATLELSLSINSSSFTGNTPIASEYHCYEIEADTPSLNYHGPKIMFLKQELPVTICTADTIGTIQSQRLFKYSLTQAQMSLWLRDQLDLRSSRGADQSLEYIVEAIKKSWVCCSKIMKLIFCESRFYLFDVL
jgi:hypothetical protein